MGKRTVIVLRTGEGKTTTFEDLDRVTLRFGSPGISTVEELEHVADRLGPSRIITVEAVGEIPAFGSGAENRDDCRVLRSPADDEAITECLREWGKQEGDD